MQKKDKPRSLPTGIRKTSSGKYIGRVADSVHAARNPGSKEQKQRHTTSFATVEEAVEAYDELKATMQSEFDEIVLDRVAKNPHTRGLERGPDNPSDATPRRVYWVCNHATSFEPRRVVAVKAGKTQGFAWAPACVHCPPDDASLSVTGKGTANEEPACKAHGVVSLPTGIYKKRSGKYIGEVGDSVHAARNPGSEQKHRYTALFATVEEAVEARDEMKATMQSEFNAIVLDRVAKDPLVRDLEEGPDDAADATPRRAYWRCNHNTSFEPKRMVAVKSGKQGFKWIAACLHCPPDDASMSMTNKGTVNEEPACIAHGARCPHGRSPGKCMECTHGIAGKPLPPHFCSQGCGIIIGRKRQRTTGGNGLCCNCEERLKREAIEAGDPDSLPRRSQRWEDTFFEKMLPLVTDAKGEVVPYEERDDFKNMLGSNKQRRIGECDTEHQRRPDCMWSVRGSDLFVYAIVVVEVDEYSHSDRNPVCESARVQDIQVCYTKLAQEEGRESDLDATREGEIAPPQVYVLRVNPNVCDAPGAVIPMQTRAQVVADRVSELLRTPAEVFRQMWKADRQMLAHVELYYYHSKSAKRLLDHYDEKVEERTLDVVPNQCPRSVEEARKARKEREDKEEEKRKEKKEKTKKKKKRKKKTAVEDGVEEGGVEGGERKKKKACVCV